MAGPADTFVTINNDTVYSMAQIDLSVGPVLLHVPDTAGRYYVLQFVDAWTNNFAYVGHRATGTAAGDFLLVPPGWTGEAPDGATVIEFPTGSPRSSAGGHAPATTTWQRSPRCRTRTTLTPLSPTPCRPASRSPPPDVPEELVFFDKLRLWSRPSRRRRADRRCRQPDAARPRRRRPPRHRRHRANRARHSRPGYAARPGRAAEVLTSGGSSPVVNGWKLTFHVFDYNLDFFQVGALDDPRFKITDPKVRIVERAAAAAGGLWGNHAYEAAYIMTYVDDHGEQLTGRRTYTLRLNPTPPVGAFWSLTMYDVPNFFLVDNPIDRYSVGDRTPGIVYDDDGSLIITISHTEPTSPTASGELAARPSR